MASVRASPAQQRFWLLQQLGAAPDASRMLSLCVRFDGELDRDRLVEAVSAVVGRHDVLRTTYRWERDRLVADVAAGTAVDVIASASPDEVADPDAAAQRRARALADEPVDLADGPLMRIGLHEHGRALRYLLVAVHHIAWDGWSTGVLLDELAIAYAHGAAHLPPLPTSYWAYGEDRWSAATGLPGERDLEYWRRQLDGLGTLPQLARRDSEEALPPIHRAQALLDGAFRTRVATFAASCGATPFAVLAAGLQVVLRQAGLGDESCLGVALSDRMDPRHEVLVGCFLNTVLLRGGVRDDDAFADVATRARDAIREAIAHGALPFELLAQRLLSGRNLQAEPLHQALVSFHPSHRATPAVGGARTTVLLGTPDRGRGDPTITIRYADPDGTIDGEWNGELALPADALLDGWREAVDAGVAAPRARLAGRWALPDREPAPPAGGWALVIGGSGAIGAATTRLLAEDGWPVAIGYRDGASRAEQLVSRVVAEGGRAMAVQLDVRDDASVEAAFAQVERDGGPVLVLVNSAGTRADRLGMHLANEAWEDVLETNLSGTFRAARRALGPMVHARWGRVISLASVAGSRASSGQSNYVAAKAGVIGLTKTLAVEVAARGVTVNAVAPGYVPSAFNADVSRDVVLDVPARRFGTAREVAACIRFLASADAGYVTGTTLVVDGGFSA